jgi:hypothetical protein
MGAAGIIACTPDGRVLLTRRAGNADHAGLWALPKGDLQEGEAKEFKPVLDAAHDDFQWVNPAFALSCSALLHPDVPVALQRFNREQKLKTIVARIEARSDSKSNGDDFMSVQSEFVTAQAQADRVAQAFGDSAPRWLDGEGLLNYKRRLAGKYKQHSTTWKDADLAKVDVSVLDQIVTQIYADAMTASVDPSRVPRGELREQIEPDRTGRRITRFVGDPESCWSIFKQPVRGVVAIGGR